MDYSGFKFSKQESILKDSKSRLKQNLVRKKRIVVSDNTYKETYKICDGKCALCNSTNVVLHHIIYKSQGKEFINDISNTIMLCTEHHLLVHSNKHKWQPILLKIRKELK